MDTGSRIKDLRKKKGFRQTDLADKVGVSSQVISNIERGVSHASAELAALIANALNVPADELVQDEVNFQIVINQEEKNLICNYRNLLPNEQKMLLGFLSTFLKKEGTDASV